jgi:hypothetical protein
LKCKIIDGSSWADLEKKVDAQREIDLAASVYSEYSRRTTAARGGDKMRLGLFLTTLIGLAGASHISSAADATWVAVSTLENGTSPYCAGGQFTGQQVSLGQADWQVDIKGNTLTSTSRATNRSFTLDLKALQPDGSGKVVGKDDKNREFYLTFDPGSGARPFHVTNSITPCRRVFTPKT